MTSFAISVPDAIESNAPTSSAVIIVKGGRRKDFGVAAYW